MLPAISSTLSSSLLIYSKFPKLTLIPLAAIISTAVTVLAGKIFDCYNPDLMSRLKLKIVEFQKSHPLTPLLMLLFVTVMGVLSLTLGVAAAIPFGIYTGCRLEMDMALRQQVLNANQPVHPHQQIALT